MAGMRQLVADVRWRWMQKHTSALVDGGLTQQKIAVRCGLDEAGFGKFYNNVRSLTSDAVLILQEGLGNLCREHKVEFEQVPNAYDHKSLAVAGRLWALNLEGGRQGVPAEFRPLSVFDYYCLRFIFASDPWYKALAGQLDAPKLNLLTQEVFRRAEKECEQMAHVLKAYAGAERRSSLPRTYAGLRTLAKAWMGPWKSVFHCLEEM
jgi:hypothetical protein